MSGAYTAISVFFRDVLNVTGSMSGAEAAAEDVAYEPLNGKYTCTHCIKC